MSDTRIRVSIHAGDDSRWDVNRVNDGDNDFVSVHGYGDGSSVTLIFYTREQAHDFFLAAARAYNMFTGDDE